MKTNAQLTPLTVKKILELNRDQKPLTPEILKQLSGWELSDEEAIEIIDSIRMFCRVIYGIFLHRQHSPIEDDSIPFTPLNKAA
jgi:hypothetical protein